MTDIDLESGTPDSITLSHGVVDFARRVVTSPTDDIRLTAEADVKTAQLDIRQET